MRLLDLMSLDRLRRTSSAISMAKAGEAGKPVLVRCVIHLTKVLTSAFERICMYSCAYEREELGMERETPLHKLE